ncbi:hypothetical protein ACFYT4_16520 [Streptomyces sp. NPDC004609]|uniref:hypothetical protein n=1 Tax=Streptomyces sp. NPDC004609 TaxID=3364704 RepID=UPI003679A1DF
MGFTAAWAISAHEDTVIAELAPRLLPVIEAERTDPVARRRWDLWRRMPLPDYRTWYITYGTDRDSREAEALRSFQLLTATAERITDMCHGGGGGFQVEGDVWKRQPDPSVMFFSSHRRTFPVGSLFHAIGPERAAQLPGWCGNFLLTSREVREALPHVERALTFGPGERAGVDAQDWLAYRPDHESVIDGPLRVWHQAARARHGLCGLALYLN